jgi:hypothetical protein
VKVFSVWLVVLCVACTSSAPVARPTTQADWDAGLAGLARLRATFQTHPYTQPVTVDFFEPRSRRRFTGRGAVGVDPGRAMRMILVGPAGEPALDVWVTRSAWRFVVPAIHLVRRGGSESPPGLPVGFFRSWFVDPLGGTLLALGPGDELVVRDIAGGTLHITNASATHGEVRRRDRTSTETFAYTLAPASGHASYVHEGTGLAVNVTLGAAQAEAPDPQAFVDPDHGGSP